MTKRTIELKLVVNADDLEYEIGRYLENAIYDEFPKSVQDKLEELSPEQIAKEVKPLENPLWIKLLERCGTDLVSNLIHEYSLTDYLQGKEKPVDLIKVKKPKEVAVSIPKGTKFKKMS